MVITFGRRVFCGCTRGDASLDSCLVRPSLKHQPDDGHSGAKSRSSHFKFFTANKLSDID